MGRKISKSAKQKKRKKLQENKIKKKEHEDLLGISRKELVDAMNPKIFVILKIISISLIPIVYFIYSPLLIVCMAFQALMILFAILAERHINHTFIKSNHITIPKFDSIIAIIVIIVALFGGILRMNSSKNRPFHDTIMETKMNLENIGSCLTGNRNIIRTIEMSFGTVPPKEGMPRPGDMKRKMDFNDLPLEMIFSMMISSVNTVLIFGITPLGILSLVIYRKRRKRFDKQLNEIIEDEYKTFTDEEFKKIFMFGYEILDKK